MFDVGIITAPREPNYLGAMLDSYFSTWKTKPHVFLEPGVNSYFNQKRVFEHHNERTLGCVANWWNAAKYMLTNTESPFVMMCEDDIEFREDAQHQITNLLKVLTGEILNVHVQRNLPLDKVGYISPYCSLLCVNGKDWHKPNLRKGGQCGALCMIFPRASLRRLIEAETHFNSKAKGLHLDYAIGDTLVKHLDLVALTHAPTLVLHIGDVSTTETNNKPANKLHDARQPAL